MGIDDLIDKLYLTLTRDHLPDILHSVLTTSHMSDGHSGHQVVSD